MISKPFKSYLGEDGGCKFVIRTIKETKYCNDVMKKYFSKELVMTKRDDEDFGNAGAGDNDYVDGDIKIKRNCYIT